MSLKSKPTYHKIDNIIFTTCEETAISYIDSSEDWCVVYVVNGMVAVWSDGVLKHTNVLSEIYDLIEPYLY